MPRRPVAEQLALLDLPTTSPPTQRTNRTGRGRSAAEVDLSSFLADLESLTEGLSGDVDPIAVELQGAAFDFIGRFGADGDDQVVAAIMAGLAQHRTPAALALTLAVAAAAEGPTRHAAAQTAAHLAAAGVPRPSWAGALAEPITAGECWRLASPDGDAAVLLGLFHRAGSAHLIATTVDGVGCGEASMVGVVPYDDRAELDGLLPGSVREPLDPAEYRWEVESALRIRDEHDADDGGPDPTDEEAVEYAACAALLRTRLAVLPQLDRPLREHPEPGGELPALTTSAPVKPAGKGRTAPKGKPTPKRSSSKPQMTSIYQVKVTLRGSRPPIWRRLEVPADLTLEKLHHVVQAAFDWDDSHLHVFVTPEGRYGAPDPELGLRSERRVTLGQVARAMKSKIVYEYDFGDSWEHEIVVEKILDRDPAIRYPRCTGGRRAAPPEDCGGVWGYAELVDALADPAHSEHEHLVSWLGLDSGDQYDPEAFDPDSINRRLSALR